MLFKDLHIIYWNKARQMNPHKTFRQFDIDGKTARGYFKSHYSCCKSVTLTAGIIGKWDLKYPWKWYLNTITLFNGDLKFGICDKDLWEVYKEQLDELEELRTFTARYLYGLTENYLLNWYNFCFIFHVFWQDSCYYSK